MGEHALLRFRAEFFEPPGRAGGDELLDRGDGRGAVRGAAENRRQHVADGVEIDRRGRGEEGFWVGVEEFS